ncbi:MAG TPA: PIG-L deacetylase family protein [Nitrospinota bacterium]|nr:PIG-L deacetylase family protein [Nitrospinota bacterium]
MVLRFRVGHLLNLDDVKKVLVLAPHPDDEAIGCGGTLLRLTKNGCYGETIFFTNGMKSETDARKEIAKIRRNEALKGSEKLGIKKCHFLNQFDSRLKSDKNSVSFVLSRLNDLKPDLVLTPFFIDNHPDHRETARILAVAASKYYQNFTYCCYELWSTLIPNSVVDITSFMEEKIAAIESHKSQTAENSLVDLAEGLNRYRAIVSGQPFQYAEAFWKVSKKEYIKISKNF